MNLGLIIAIALGLLALLVVVFAAFIAMTLLQAAFSFEELDYDDNFDDELLDEDHHVKPLLGTVYPKEK